VALHRIRVQPRQDGSLGGRVPANLESDSQIWQTAEDDCRAHAFIAIRTDFPRSAPTGGPSNAGPTETSKSAGPGIAWETAWVSRAPGSSRLHTTARGTPACRDLPGNSPGRSGQVRRAIRSAWSCQWPSRAITRRLRKTGVPLRGSSRSGDRFAELDGQPLTLAGRTHGWRCTGGHPRPIGRSISRPTSRRVRGQTPRPRKRRDGPSNPARSPPGDRVPRTWRDSP